MQCIVVALGGLFFNVAGVAKKNIAKDDIRISMDKLGDATTGITYHTPVAIECQLRIDDAVYHWIRSRVDSENSHTKIDNRDICKWMNTIIETLNVKLEHAINEDDYNTAEQIIAEMKEQLGDSHGEVIRAIDLLEINS